MLMFLQCVFTVIIVYIIISTLNSYLYIHWILDQYYYYYYKMYIVSNSYFIDSCFQLDFLRVYNYYSWHMSQIFASLSRSASSDFNEVVLSVG